jgi:hypothetical protein
LLSFNIPIYGNNRAYTTDYTCASGGGSKVVAQEQQRVLVSVVRDYCQNYCPKGCQKPYTDNKLRVTAKAVVFILKLV